MIWGHAWNMHGPAPGCWLPAAPSPSVLCGTSVCWVRAGSRELPSGHRPFSAHLSAAWLQLTRWERFPSLKSASTNERSCIRLSWLYTSSPSKLYLSSFTVLVACSLPFSRSYPLLSFVDSTLSLLSKAYNQTSYALWQHSYFQNFLLLSCSLWTL